MCTSLTKWGWNVKIKRNYWDGYGFGGPILIMFFSLNFHISTFGKEMMIFSILKIKQGVNIHVDFCFCSKNWKMRKKINFLYKDFLRKRISLSVLKCYKRSKRNYYDGYGFGAPYLSSSFSYFSYTFFYRIWWYLSLFTSYLKHFFHLARHIKMSLFFSLI